MILLAYIDSLEIMLFNMRLVTVTQPVVRSHRMCCSTTASTACRLANTNVLLVLSMAQPVSVISKVAVADARMPLRVQQ